MRWDGEVWSAIHVSLVQHDDQTVAVIHCPPRASETWHREDTGERFYIRASNATEELTARGPRQVHAGALARMSFRRPFLTLGQKRLPTARPVLRCGTCHGHNG